MDLTGIKNPMDFVDLIWHVAGFIAPAVFVALGVALAGWIFESNRPSALVLLARAAINFAACVAVLMLALALTGQDGRLLTYGALVLVSAAVEAFRVRRR